MPAKRIRKSLTLAMAALSISSLPAGAQTYHYNYGGSRVIIQSQTGMYQPSSTYIGGGTLSRSAQGLPAGVTSGGLSGLPNVHMSGAVGTPGDNQYTDPVQYERHYGHRRRMPVTNMGPYVGGAGDQMRWQGHLYIPGQNSGSDAERRLQGQYPSSISRRGQGPVATYAEKENYNIGNNGTFQY